MTTFGYVLQGIQRLVLTLKSGVQLTNSVRCCSSTAATGKIVKGPKGEQIFQSVYGEVSYPDITVPEYVWRDVQLFPNKIALECGVTGRNYTFAQARDASNYVARSLLNMGLKEGDVVALIAPNFPETILAFLGILEAGLVVTTINPLYTFEEMSRQLESSGAKGVITSGEIANVALQAAAANLPKSAPFIVIDDVVTNVPDNAIPFKDLITKGKSLPPVPSKTIDINNVAVLPYSSGTTGLPKGVMLSHKNLVSNIEMVDGSTDLDMWLPTTETTQDVIPVFLPFFHIFGMNGIVLPRLSRGNRLITLPKFLPETFLNVLDKSKATGLFCVPPVILFLSASPLVKKQHIQHVRSVFSGAAPLAGCDVDRFYEKFDIGKDDLKFCQGYGLTECSPVSFVERSGTKFASIGKNVQGCEARLVDPITHEDVTKSGQTGEIWVRGPHIMKGYLNNEAATKDCLLDDGWLKTGDIAHYDEELDFYVTDRLKELIKVKGFQVAPAELEGLLRTHPHVEEAAVIGIPDPISGEIPKAFVLLKKEKKSTSEDIVNFVKGKVSEYKQLQGGVQFVDSIPKNASGKILRAKLKSDYGRPTLRSMDRYRAVTGQV